MPLHVSNFHALLRELLKKSLLLGNKIGKKTCLFEGFALKLLLNKGVQFALAFLSHFYRQAYEQVFIKYILLD